MTCCFFSSLKTLLTLTEGNPHAMLNVLGSTPLAGFQVILIGRFWVIPEGEKSIRGGESCALVAIDKGMVLSKTLPESGGFLDQVSVITGLRPVECGFQQTLIPDAVGSIWSACMASTSATVR